MDLYDRHDTVRLTPDEQDLCIRLLGEFSVSRAGQSVDAASWRFRNAKRLIQILALAHDHRVHREQIIDLFWPESHVKPAHNNLNQILHHARRALGSIGLGRQVLRLERNVLSLDVPGRHFWIDADAFDGAAQQARQGDDPALCLAVLDICRGKLLPEETYADWAMNRREALHNTQFALRLHLGTIYENRYELVNAEDVYSRLVLEDPAHEAAQAGLMRVYALTGRRHRALLQYQHLETATLRELDLEPDSAVQDLRARIEAGTFSSRSVAGVSPAVADDREIPIVGRERELHALRNAIELSFAGHGHVLMISGEPGVGKTRTALKALEFAQRCGSTVYWGHCVQDEGAPAYWPWVQVIRSAVSVLDTESLRHALGRGAGDIIQIVPEIGDRLPDVSPAPRSGAEQARFQLFDSMSRFFRNLALRTPVLIVLDDLHWSDRSTLLMLSFLAREMQRSRVVIVGTFRNTDTVEEHPLRGTLAELNRSSAFQHLHLTGLSGNEVRSIVQSSLDGRSTEEMVALIFERTEGNPFFVGEILRMVREEGSTGAQDVAGLATMVPPSVREVINHRLSRLALPCVTVLSCAAVIGREFALPVLEPVATTNRDHILDSLEEAHRSHLIEESSDRTGWFRFTHALVQETVYSNIPASRRAELHMRAGRTIETLHAGELDGHVPVLAHHFAIAALRGRIGPAVEYGVRAGDQALSRIAYSEALDYYRKTLDVIEGHDPAARRELLGVLLKLGDAYNHIGVRHEARSTFSQAIHLSRELDVPEVFAQATLGYVGLGIFAIGPDHVTLLEEAIQRLPEEDTVVRAKILARLAFESISSPMNDKPTTLIDEAERIARRINDPSTLIFVLITKCWTVVWLDNLAERLSISSEVLGLIESSGELLLQPTAHAMHLYEGFETGDIDLVDDQIAIFADLAHASREPQRAWLSMIFRVTRMALTGHYSEAESFIEQARAAAGDSMAALTHDRRVLSPLITIRREQGRLNEILDVVAEVASSNPDNLYWQTMHVYVKSHVTSPANMSLDAGVLIDQIESAGRLDPNGLAAAAHLSMATTIGEFPDLAGRLYRIFEPFTDLYLFAKLTHHPYGPVAYYAGCLASVLGCLDDAEHHLQRAIAMSCGLKARPLLARSQFELAKVLRGRDTQGYGERCRHLLDTAQSTALEVGMPMLVRDIQTELQSVEQSY